MCGVLHGVEDQIDEGDHICFGQGKQLWPGIPVATFESRQFGRCVNQKARRSFPDLTLSAQPGAAPAASVASLVTTFDLVRREIVVVVMVVMVVVVVVVVVMMMVAARARVITCQ